MHKKGPKIRNGLGSKHQVALKTTDCNRDSSSRQL